MVCQLEQHVATVIVAATAVVGVFGPLRCGAVAAEPNRPARDGVGARLGGHLRIHVGPILPYGVEPYDEAQCGDYRSRGAYRVIGRTSAAPSQMTMPTVPDAATFRSWALSAFRNRRYGEAMRLLKHSLVEDERNGTTRLFLSHTQLATGQYEAAAESLLRGLALLDPADWGYVVQNRRRWYADDDYERQLRALASFIGEHPEASFARFLRGYHAVYLGRKDVASEDLRKAAHSGRYLDFAVELLAMIATDKAEKPGVEELPTPTAPTSERSP